ncbi:MAG: glycosyltransferase family 2 protein [Candidatus Marinimicrobia bacterium]|nr:glycosyltransferase family 2 protein [Candidatus Neomarinimicrobiota bacterium]MBT7377064.1 glycosyltransferase family 2 protein [Candidatus Neomarinimicrobiota bacterium]
MIKQSVSIVIPVYNEDESISALYSEVKNSLESFPSHEIIFINDGSFDNSLYKITTIVEQDSAVTLIDLYSNFGKADALNEGFKVATGDIIITMDADLQDDPAEISNLVSKINEGWDVVSGWKVDRQDPISKRWPSKLFNAVMRFVTKVKIHDFNCGLKAYRQKVVKAIDLYGGMHRYTPALAAQKGFSVTEIPVNHRSRKFGVTKYGGSRIFHGFYDLLTVMFLGKYLTRPLHFFGSIGLVLLSAGFAINVYLTVGWFNGIWIGNRPIFFLGILLLIVGIQFFSMGLIGELITKTAHRNESIVLRKYKKEQ